MRVFTPATGNFSCLTRNFFEVTSTDASRYSALEAKRRDVPVDNENSDGSRRWEGEGSIEHGPHPKQAVGSRPDQAFAAISEQAFQCVLLADRHRGLAEGIRGLLTTLFKAVVMVADVDSLHESASRLRPDAAVVALSLARDRNLRWLQQLRRECPETKLIVLSELDDPSVRCEVLSAGADAFIVTRAISTDLLTAIESVFEPSADRGPRNR